MKLGEVIDHNSADTNETLVGCGMWDVKFGIEQRVRRQMTDDKGYSPSLCAERYANG